MIAIKMIDLPPAPSLCFWNSGTDGLCIAALFIAFESNANFYVRWLFYA